MEKRNNMIRRSAAARGKWYVQTATSAKMWLARRNAFAKKVKLPRLRSK